MTPMERIEAVLRMNNVPETDQLIIQIAIYDLVNPPMDDAIAGLRREVANAPDVKRGKGTVQSARLGGEASRKLNEAERVEARRKRDELMAKGHSKHDASGMVAPDYAVSVRTIERL